MDILTQIELAEYEKVEAPEVEKSNFLYSFSFLPKEERNAMHTIYSFCSYIDDIVDNHPAGNIDDKKDRLAWWENVVERIYLGEIKNVLIDPLVNVIERFNIPKQYFLTLIDGCRRDLYQNEYDTFEELKEYCYGVASVVGLISIEIFGYKYEDTKNYAINLGYALQLTNIMRDIKADKDRGYIYIPKDDLEKAGLTREDIKNEIYDDRFVDMMQRMAKRAREYYHKARTSLHPNERITIVTAEVMDAIYYRLLDKIELNDYNIFKKKIKVSKLHKIMIALKHWLSVRMFISRFKKIPQ